MKEEKKTEIDPRAYFSMFGSKDKKTPTEKKVKKKEEPTPPVPEPKPEEKSIDLEDDDYDLIDELLEQDNQKSVAKNTQEASEDSRSYVKSTQGENSNKFPSREHSNTEAVLTKQPKEDDIKNNPVVAKPKEQVSKVKVKKFMGAFSGQTFAILGEMNSVSVEELTKILREFGA